ncbi:MAG: cytochrome c oxidase subunit 3 [Flavobacteriaceae bacterium]|nr:cytochrome c oxidase subunit 3 [Flavobacteriaceae bacterium]MCI5089158.1 cytochrome c oxidase subunit 3 [Flavobacteriaceae bacterium]CAI8190748.1 MAG: Cytochrome c oxidase subunit 3 [SAR116 cluster bacterium]
MSVDFTKGSAYAKNARAKKMMLWFGIISLIMGFAGWTSAFIVSSSREDWFENFVLPTPFWYSTAVIVLSSVTFMLAKASVKKGLQRQTTLFLVSTLVLGVVFIGLQFSGFSVMIAMGYYFTGPTSNVTLSYIFLIAFVHILHLVAGLISLIVVIVNQLRGKYNQEEYLGLSLGETFWHFLDLLWVYLVLFFYFFA